jgi:hypothetical protein
MSWPSSPIGPQLSEPTGNLNRSTADAAVVFFVSIVPTTLTSTRIGNAKRRPAASVDSGQAGGLDDFRGRGHSEPTPTPAPAA